MVVSFSLRVCVSLPVSLCVYVSVCPLKLHTQPLPQSFSLRQTLSLNLELTDAASLAAG